MGNCASGEEDDNDKGVVMKVNDKSYKCVRRLGEGGYSQVFLVAETTLEKKLFALKRMNLGSEELLEQASREIEIMKKFTHPNIISLIDYESSPNNALLLLPFYSGGTLEEAITSPTTQFNSHESVRRVFLGICRGVEQLHKAELAHRDLKPLNVLLSTSSSSDTNNVVLCDLGSVATAKISIPTFRDATKLQEHCDRTCSPLYRAPELYDVDTDALITDKTDIWSVNRVDLTQLPQSLGCILYFMIYGYSPFERAANEPGSSIKLAVVNGKISFQDETLSNRKYSDDSLRLIKWMLEKDPTKRPDIDVVIQSITGSSSDRNSIRKDTGTADDALVGGGGGGAGDGGGSWKASFD